MVVVYRCVPYLISNNLLLLVYQPSDHLKTVGNSYTAVVYSFGGLSAMILATMMIKGAMRSPCNMLLFVIRSFLGTIE